MDKLLHCIYKYPDRQFKTALDNKEKIAMSYHLTTETHSGKLLSPIPRFGQYKTGSKLFLDILVQANVCNTATQLLSSKYACTN